MPYGFFVNAGLRLAGAIFRQGTEVGGRAI